MIGDIIQFIRDKIKMRFEKITSWNKTLWIVVVIIWSIVGVQWVAQNIDPETGHRIGLL